MIPKDIIDTIFETARIEEVIGEYVQLKKAGSNLKGLSPFTNEKTPSFVVSPGKQIFKCFSSGKGGSVVTFLMEQEHFSYPEALRFLAKKYNIEIPERELTAEERAQINEKESLFLVSEAAQKFFSEQLLASEEGKAIGLSYLKGRGLDQAIIDKFGLGYSPEKKDAFTKYALDQGFQKKYLTKTGLTLEKHDIDRFYGRVMFPIHSASGRVLGFGGRILKSNAKAAKYLNSPESDIYHKSKILYGIYQAKQSIIKNDLCYLVEGYTDVIALHQKGIENVVASSGTALTPDQIRLVRRLSQNICVLYDGDNAGIKAAFRGIDLILAEGMQVKVVAFPEGEDPDSFSKGKSSEEVQAFLENSAQDFISFKTEILLGEAQGDPVKRAGLIKQVLESIAVVDDLTLREIYIKDTATRFEMKEHSLSSEVERLRLGKLEAEAKQAEREAMRPEPLEVAYTAKEAVQVAAKDEEQEKALIRLLLNDGEAVVQMELSNEEGQVEETELSVAEFIVHSIQEDDLSFDHALYQEIFDAYASGLEREEILDASYFTKHENPALVNLVSDLISEAHQLSPSWKKKEVYIVPRERKIRKDALMSVLYFKRKKLQRMIEGLQENLKRGEFNEQIMEQLMHFNQLKDHIDRHIERAK